MGVDFLNFKKKSKLNLIGLYTGEQVEELHKRNKDLWQGLSMTHSYLKTYASAIKNLADEGTRFSYEERMSLIRAYCDKLVEAEGRAEVVLFDD